MKKLQGKAIVVTGSSMGIGQAVALRLAKEGASVAVNARGMDALQETIGLIEASGGHAVASCGSVADFDYAGELIQSCIDQFGRIDGLINCAGIVEPQGSSISNIALSDWHQLIDVHLHGTFNTCRHAAEKMIEQGGGSIINTSSHAFLGMYGGTGYAAGKGATNSLSLAMAMDLKEHGVNVNVICPGAKTRMSTGDDYEQLIDELSDRGLLDDAMREYSLNPADPSYVASLYAYLMSDEASDISGRVFWGMGGYIGAFHRNDDQLIGFKDHDFFPPWQLDELASKCDTKIWQQPEQLYNVLGHFGPFRFAAKQQTLLKLVNSRLGQFATNIAKSIKAKKAAKQR